MGEGLTATDSLLSKWIDGHSIVYKKLHGEMHDADSRGVNDWIKPKL